MKCALLVIDMQKAFYEGKVVESMNSACEYINAVVPLFREKDLPVIWVYQQDKEEGLVFGKPDFEFIEKLIPIESDYKITKNYGNSFNKTECKSILDKHKVDTVIITGYCAEHCVLSTFIGAQDVDVTPIMLRGSLASGNIENIGFVDRICNVITYEVLKKLLENG
jgi:nicotinamidase-related amidase